MSDILKLTREDDPPVSRVAGWDFLTAAAGQEAEVRCRICGEVMAVRRGVVGPTGWAHALAIHDGAARGTRRDVFSCAFSAEAWHRQALALRQEAARTPSGRLATLLLDEAEQVLRERTPTKAD